MNWPDQIPNEMRHALEQVPHDYPMIGNWDEEDSFRAADDVMAIARVLIPKFHSELGNAQIVYLFREKSDAGPGKAVKLGARERYLTDLDFCITVAWASWRRMDIVQRTALVDKQLQRCGLSDTGTPILVDHDLQEFNAIVGRWGMWDRPTEDFLRAAKQQFDMFGEEPNAEAQPVELVK